MSEPKKFNCESARPNDYISAEVSALPDRMRVSVLQEGVQQWVTLRAERARAFAADIIRIADEIDPPKEKPMSTKKPIEFEARMVGLHTLKAVDDSFCVQLHRGGVGLLFENDTLPAFRKALDEYEAAVKKANTLTLGDLELDEWFHFVGEDASRICCAGPHMDGFKESRHFSRPRETALETKKIYTPVIRLKATFEVVE